MVGYEKCTAQSERGNVETRASVAVGRNIQARDQYGRDPCSSSIVGWRLCERRDGVSGESPCPAFDGMPILVESGVGVYFDGESFKEYEFDDERVCISRVGICVPYDISVSVDCALGGSAYVVVGVKAG